MDMTTSSKSYHLGTAGTDTQLKTRNITTKAFAVHVKALFKRCEEHGITLSDTKYQVGNKVKFARYVVSDKGTRPDPDKVAAISQFPMPEDLTYLRSFLGLANQLDFSPDLRHSMEPM